MTIEKRVLKKATMTTVFFFGDKTRQEQQKSYCHAEPCVRNKLTFSLRVYNALDIYCIIEHFWKILIFSSFLSSEFLLESVCKGILLDAFFNSVNFRQLNRLRIVLRNRY